MITLRTIRSVAWVGVAIAGFLFLSVAGGWFVTDGPLGKSAEPRANKASAGDFSLIDQFGRPFKRLDLSQKPTLLFFGFTYCPEICPTALANLSSWLDTLGTDSDILQSILVTVDPERDTPEVLANYVAPFGGRFRALTGPEKEIAKLASYYRATYRKVLDSSGGYTMDHSAIIYLLDRQTRFVGAVDLHENDEAAIAKIRRLIDSRR